MLCCALVLLKKRRRPGGAKWYGKVATVMFYVSVSVIVVMDGLHLAATPHSVLCAPDAYSPDDAVRRLPVFPGVLHPAPFHRRGKPSGSPG